MPCPSAGYLHMDPIMELAKRHNLMVIEDSARRSSAKDDKGQPSGTIGHCGSFSFEQTRMTTGDGGMLVTNDPDLARGFGRWANGPLRQR